MTKPTTINECQIRDATATDCADMLSIYTPYITDTAITFEETVPSVEAFSQRYQAIRGQQFPWFVSELDGQNVGYAYATQWKARSAYRFTAETTIYLDRHANITSKGIGTALYQALFAQLQACNIHAAIGVITLPNPASIALHEKMGMTQVAHFPEVGYKFNQWLDVGYWQRILR